MTADAQFPLGVPGDNITVVIEESSSPPSEPTDLTLAAASALLALLVAGAVVRRRNPEKAVPRRLRRLLDPSLLFAAAFTLWLVADELRFPDSSTPLLLVAGIAIVVTTAIALAIFAVLDFWLWRFRPVRSRRWLIVAVLAFGGAVETLAAAALVSGGGVVQLLNPAHLPIAVMAAAAGLIWWSSLPIRQQDLTQLFE